MIVNIEVDPFPTHFLNELLFYAPKKLVSIRKF